jgi:tetratricopeptide (TPR) repeat protein
MPRKIIYFLFLILLGVAIIAGLRRQPVRAVFGAATLIGGQQVTATWELEAPCTPIPAANLTLPESNSHYFRGLRALSTGEKDQARAYFLAAVEENEHPVALIILANMADAPVEAAIFPGRWTDGMRLSLAEYYLTIAGRCLLADEQETARDYLARGETFLPPAGIPQLPLGVARNASDIYLADQDWDAALPWLEHAAAANDASLLRLAFTYYQLGHLEEAAAAYEQALIYYPQHTPTRVRAARVLADMRDFPAALAILNGMAEPSKLGVDDLLLWADLCGETADWDCQETQYRRVLTLDPQNETATAGLQALQP